MNRDLSTDAIRPVPQRRIIDKMDEYMSRRDYNGAERHLLYWLEEAKLGGDLRGQLMLRNELVGHYRKTGQKEPAMESAEKALALLRELDMEDTITAGTTYVNIATACGAFGDHERAIRLFEKARIAYESSSQTGAQLLGGLYNNMGLAYMDTGQYGQAHDCYAKALETMSRADHGELESAITLLNMADTLSLEKGLIKAQDEINDYMERAMAFLNTESLPRNGYYAFVAERCAPGFYCYGFDEYGAELEERAKAIREALGAL